MHSSSQRSRRYHSSDDAPAGRRQVRPSTRPLSVLVIEGQLAERTVVVQLIRRDPGLHLAGAAATTADANQMLSDNPTLRPDLICLSWLLDGGQTDRWDFLAELRQICPDSHILMLCPVETPCIIQQAIESGIVALHATRDSFESLQRALRCAAHGREYLSPSLRLIQETPQQLNQRQQEVLALMSEGASRPEIARRLGISEATVRSHTKLIFSRLGVNERAHAVAVGLRAGLIG
jgi:DNA-binding NarL/FixJ family response regulator